LEKSKKKQAIAVIQLSLDNKYINQWDSVNNASNELTINAYSILNVCKGKQKTSGGYKWMYKEEYDNLIKNN
jgi:hypothetical protein